MNFRLYILILIIASSFSAWGQTSYLVRNNKEEFLLNRLEIKLRTKALSFSSKPYARRDMAKDLDQYDSLYAAADKKAKHITEIDKYNIQRFLMNSSEWSKPKEIYKSEKPFKKIFYQYRGDMLNLQGNDFTLIANPIINYQMGSKADNTEKTFLNQRGLVARGIIGSKIGFQFYFTENQERQPGYVQEWSNTFRAIPGAGYMKSFKVNGFDYFDIRSSINWKVAKFMDMQLAYDRNFIGNGYRSLFLSDFSTSYNFLKITTRFGKFTYQNIFSEMVGQHYRRSDYIYPRKYVRFNYLQFHASNWFNLGLFEGVILAKNDEVSLGLFNPIIFAHASQKFNNLKDKSYKGFDIKMNLFKKVQVYTQTLIDNVENIDPSSNWWENRFSYQIGFKYIDLFKVKNLDLQAETNVVRPFMYTAADDVTNYTHYNQPIAHPLGANFSEYIGILRYQPLKRLYLESKLIFYQQGADSSIAGINQNYGSNLFANNSTRPFENGWQVGTGSKVNCLLYNFTASYELRENLFVDLNYLNRQYDNQVSGKTSTSVFSLGIRWNIARRELLF